LTEKCGGRILMSTYKTFHISHLLLLAARNQLLVLGSHFETIESQNLFSSNSDFPEIQLFAVVGSGRFKMKKEHLPKSLVAQDLFSIQ